MSKDCEPTLSKFQTGKFVFWARKIFFTVRFFTVRFARLENYPPITSPYETRYFQILSPSLAFACMAACLRAEDLQRALHTFHSGANCTLHTFLYEAEFLPSSGMFLNISSNRALNFSYIFLELITRLIIISAQLRQL